MYTIYYDAIAVASLAATIVYLVLWQKRFNMQITMVFMLMPVVNLAHALMAHTTSLEAALTANRIIYLGGSYLPLIILLVICALCGIRVPRWVRCLLMAASTGIYISALSMGQGTLFYKDV